MTWQNYYRFQVNELSKRQPETTPPNQRGYHYKDTPLTWPGNPTAFKPFINVFPFNLMLLHLYNQCKDNRLIKQQIN